MSATLGGTPSPVLSLYVDGGRVAMSTAPTNGNFNSFVGVSWPVAQLGGTLPAIPFPVQTAVPWKLSELQVYGAALTNEGALFSGTAFGCPTPPASPPPPQPPSPPLPPGRTPRIAACASVLSHRIAAAAAPGGALVDAGLVGQDGIAPSLAGNATFDAVVGLTLGVNGSMNLLAPGARTTFKFQQGGYPPLTTGVTMLLQLNVPAPSPNMTAGTTNSSMLVSFSGAGGDGSYFALFLTRTPCCDFLTLAAASPSGYMLSPGVCTSTSSTYPCIDVRPLAGTWVTVAYTATTLWSPYHTLSVNGGAYTGTNNGYPQFMFSTYSNIAQIGGTNPAITAVSNQVSSPMQVADFQLYYMPLPQAR